MPSEKSRTRRQLPRLGVGTAPLGGLFTAVSDEEAASTLAAALSGGIRLFDTAPLYGLGESERRVGRALRQAPREDLVLSTKVGRLIRPADDPNAGEQQGWKGAGAVQAEFDFSAEGTRQAFAESLERLGMDRVDIAHIHDPDAHLEEARAGSYEVLADLREQGVVEMIGVGANSCETLLSFARNSEPDCFLVAGRYTLLDQSALVELMPECSERGITVIIGGVFNSGILAGPGPEATFNYAPAPQDLIDRAFALKNVCERHGVPLKAAALQFPFGHPAVSTVLLGVRSVAELDENLKLAAHPIPSDLWSDLKAEGLLARDCPVPGGV